MKKLFITLCFILLISCSKEPNLKSKHLLTVESRISTNSLLYSGIIQPITTLVIPCPVDGAVVDMPFQYGEPVKSGQLLFVISSTKFLSDYKNALMQYLKAKNDFSSSETQLKEGNFLHKNQLISEDDYKSKQSNFYSARLAYAQAKDALEVLLHQLSIKDLDLYKLSIADIDKINEALHLQTSSEDLRIISPAAGVILSTSKNEDEVKKLIKGDTVKQGDALAMIGDVSGLLIRIKVNELTVNQLKPGQKVKVTGVAFPEEILQGEVKRVDKQGEPSNSGLPNFTVEVIVPKLNEKQQQIIHVGMSAKVQIDIDDTPQVIIPLNALQEKNGDTFVSLYNEKTRQTNLAAVKTGSTTLDSVTILSGLKVGDKIVIPD